jgi:hypothetical protein
MADTPLTNNDAIALAHMPQQAHVWRAEDDWTGVIDRKERRRLQNRQNQRKWRMQPVPLDIHCAQEGVVLVD